MGVVSQYKKIKMSQVFADNVISMHREEVFGVKSGGVQWGCIFKDYLIINALKNCSNTFTQEEVECLYNKITNINN